VTGLPIRQFRNAFIPLYFQWKIGFSGINLLNKLKCLLFSDVVRVWFAGFVPPTCFVTQSVTFPYGIRGPAEVLISLDTSCPENRYDEPPGSIIANSRRILHIPNIFIIITPEGTPGPGYMPPWHVSERRNHS
jgi:hypothetical protein